MKVKVQTLDVRQGRRRHRSQRRDLRRRAARRHPPPRRHLAARATAAAPPAPPASVSEVTRTGKKFGRQKGGGTARHGDRRAPIFIGGGKAHGPRVRVFNPSLNKKVRALGLRMALSSKAMDGKLVVIDNLDLKEGKTRELQRQARQASASARPRW